MYYPLQLKFLETVHTLCGRIPQVFLKQIEKTMRRAYEKHVIIHMGPNSMSWVPPLLWVSLASVTEDMDRMLPGYLCVCRFTGALWLLRFKCLVTFCLSCLSLKGNVLFFIVFKYYLSFFKRYLFLKDSCYYHEFNILSQRVGREKGTFPSPQIWDPVSVWKIIIIWYSLEPCYATCSLTLIKK